ncbi:peptidase S10, serine carboxypeptidase, partial [Kipferlia bialata]
HPTDMYTLERIAVGDGMTYPEVQMGAVLDFAWGFGLIDQLQRDELAPLQDRLVNAIATERWTESHTLFGELLSKVLYDAGEPNQYNVMNWDDAMGSFDTIHDYLMTEEARDALHAGSIEWTACNDTVSIFLWNDYFSSSQQAVIDVLEAGIDVLIYSGNADLIITGLGQELWTYAMEWEGQEEFLAATRGIWNATNTETGKDEVCGTWKHSRGDHEGLGALSVALVYDSGHLVPQDQPLHAYAMMERYVTDDYLNYY